MEFSWTDEQRDLRAALRRLMQTHAPVERARALAEAGQRRDDELWAIMAGQLGLQALGVPEEHGGVGATLVDRAVVLEETGAVLLGGPYLSTAVLAAEVLVAAAEEGSEPAGRLLPDLAAGELTATVAVLEGATDTWDPGRVGTTATDGAEPLLTGSKEVVLDGQDADVLLVLAGSPSGVHWYLVEPSAPGARRVSRAPLDATRAVATVQLDGAPGTLLGESDGIAVADRLWRTAAVLVAAEQVGAAGTLVSRTADYVTTRRQFGRPVGSFQGVKHRMADMAVRLEMARSAAYWAAWQEPGSREQEVGALVARSYASDALLQTAKDTIQLHGGIGFTWEHDAHLFLRRARLDASLLGSPAQCRERLFAVVGPSVRPELEEVS